MAQVRRQLRQWLQHEPPLRQAWVWDLQARLIDDAVAEQDDVRVRRAGPPARARRAAGLRLGGLGRVEQLARCAFPAAFDYLVQESRLVGHPERLRLAHG